MKIKTKRHPGQAHMASFIDNPAIKGREDKFLNLNIAVLPVIASWRKSLFAHEWLKSDGSLKSLSELNEANREKRLTVEAAFRNGQPLLKPILGLGLTDSVEIGSGKDVLLTLACLAQDTVSVHIPKSHADEFKVFLR